jgi:hypothetical protein
LEVVKVEIDHAGLLACPEPPTAELRSTERRPIANCELQRIPICPDVGVGVLLRTAMTSAGT